MLGMAPSQDASDHQDYYIFTSYLLVNPYNGRGPHLRYMYYIGHILGVWNPELSGRFSANFLAWWNLNPRLVEPQPSPGGTSTLAWWNLSPRLVEPQPSPGGTSAYK